jgi:hypothetical protein
VKPEDTKTPPQQFPGYSWVAVLGEAATRGLQWGVDIVCTFGPASTFTTNYYTASYAHLTCCLAFSVVMAACSALVLWRGDRPWSFDLLATLMLAVAMTLMTLSRDAFLFACALIKDHLGKHPRLALSPPEVSINVTHRSGAQLQYRLIPASAWSPWTTIAAIRPPASSSRRRGISGYPAPARKLGATQLAGERTRVFWPASAAR